MVIMNETYKKMHEEELTHRSVMIRNEKGLVRIS